MKNLVSKGSCVLLLGLAALFIFLALPGMLRSTIDPFAQGFPPDTLGAAALGALQYFAALSIAYVSWRYLFPGFHAYAMETIESKLLEAVTLDLFERLDNDPPALYGLEALAERRKISTLQFTIRCVRFLLSVSPFVIFFIQASHSLMSALTAVPAAVPVL